MVASFRHLTSAPRPFPHHHNVIANTVRLTDGTSRALDARALSPRSGRLGARDRRDAPPAHQRPRRGWRQAASPAWEIDGITSQVVGEFSKRRNEIDDALRELEERSVEARILARSSTSCCAPPGQEPHASG